ncbi:protein GVQW3-like [Stegodyphus dumicola]|uniref:protein GVQW3-like n=1 Tax=Stegodyphus dumicola TaxID=202533 RepID=UPI0015AAB2FA|nr:protein GVQW3-like [Stegodyphus dumicola]
MQAGHFPGSCVFERYKRFREGGNSVQDDPKAVLTSTAHTDANVERVRQLLQEDRCVTVRRISEELNLNRDFYHKILREDLGKRKLNARIVPHSLTDEQKEERRRISAKLLGRARRDPTFVLKIISVFP